MSPRLLQWTERGLFALGITAAVLFIGLSLPGIFARGAQASEHPAPVDESIFPPTSLDRAYLGGRVYQPSSVIARMEIPALKIDAPVIEGISDLDLRKGIGHVPGSADSGGLGNMVLAAHRDRIFRPLRSVAKGMDIQLKGSGGTYHYRVDSTQIVSPDQLEVLEIASQPQVTLITCYPFNYIGSAPMRFIVKAHLVSALPD